MNTRRTTRAVAGDSILVLNRPPIRGAAQVRNKTDGKTDSSADIKGHSQVQKSSRRRYPKKSDTSESSDDEAAGTSRFEESLQKNTSFQYSATSRFEESLQKNTSVQYSGNYDEEEDYGDEEEELKEERERSSSFNQQPDQNASIKPGKSLHNTSFQFSEDEEVKPESQGVHKIQTRIDEEVKPESQGVHKIQTRSGKARIDHRGDSKQGSFIHREEVKRGSQEVNLPKPILQTSSVYTLYILFSVLLAVAVFAIFKSKVDNKSEVIKAFRDQFRGVQSFYPAQTEALRLSKRILELHLNRSKENTQPAIILLAAAQDAEQTLHCLSNHLAKAYSRSRNSSYMVISGENETFHSSEETKLAIDHILSSGFQTTSTAAVLHRLELLHSGALLILYKYCDHENAAFKNVALILTVVLEDSTLAPQLSLTELEEKVRDSLYDQFSGTHNGRSHSEMDRDKLGGVWSRISHAVLPVYPEKSIQEACRDTEHGA